MTRTHCDLCDVVILLPADGILLARGIERHGWTKPADLFVRHRVECSSAPLALCEACMSKVLAVAKPLRGAEGESA